MAKKSTKDVISDYESIKKYLQDEANYLRNINDFEGERARKTEIISDRQKVINELLANSGELTKKQQEYLNKLIEEQRTELANEKEINTQLEKGIKFRQKNVDIGKQIINQLKNGWQYLQQQDKIIKTTTLNLGMSGVKAEILRSSFEQSASYVARLGGSLEDVQNIMQGYADETGRSRALSAEMVKDITAIGKGTGLGVEQATRLGAQFEIMGVDARSTMEYVQGVVDTSERMGINTTKVLKNVNDNFKRLNTYTFQQGVKGFAQMASYAEKFKIDIGQALNAADVAKTLEGAIDLTAQLQVMGGEFAKTDPFEMLFLSRNDPAKFTEKIGDMTKGVVSFRKMADGSFEKFISPADRDRLAAVAKSMGMEASALTEIAQRQADIQKMRQQMAGMGLSEEQKKLIEGAAIFDTKSGKFQVQLAGTMKDISTLTKDQANSFVKQTVSLEDRAKQAQTFDETFKNTINSLKSALLPILRSVNGLLEKLKPIADWFGEIAGSSGGWWKAGSILLAGALAWKGASLLFNKGIENYVKGGLSSVFSGAKANGSTKGLRGLVGGSAKAKANAGSAMGKGAGGAGNLSSLGKGAGFGVAMAGAGAGVMLAADGISKLADSMSKLTPEQAKTLSEIVKSLSWFMVGAAAAAVGVVAFGAGAAAAAPGLLAFGAAVLMVGGGIGIAAAGIGYMAQGLGKLVDSSKGAGKDMRDIGLGIGTIAGSLALMNFGAIGLLTFAGVMKTISKNAPALAVVGSAFKEIHAVMSGSKDDFIAVQKAVESISKMNVKGGGALAELTNMLKNPIKVEFSEGRVAMVNDITLNLDGQKFMQKAYNVNLAIQKQEALRSGKGNNA
jgi:hypothetical protein